MSSVDYVIHVDCIEDTPGKLKTVIPVSKMFVTLLLEVSYVPFVTKSLRFCR